MVARTCLHDDTEMSCMVKRQDPDQQILEGQVDNLELGHYCWHVWMFPVCRYTCMQMCTQQKIQSSLCCLSHSRDVKLETPGEEAVVVESSYANSMAW